MIRSGPIPPRIMARHMQAPANAIDRSRSVIEHRRRSQAALLVLAGIAATLTLLAVGASPGLVTVPIGLACVIALLILPFPDADFWLALSLVATLPLLPPSPLPNLPVSAA